MDQRQLTLTALALTLVLAGANMEPTARADQVPAGSGFYMHVGDDLLHTTGGLQFSNPTVSDGNESSGVIIAQPSGNSGSFSGGCSAANAAVNSTVPVANAPVVDLIHYTGVYNWPSPGGFTNCVTMGIAFTDGSTITVFGPTSTGAGDTVVSGWLNTTGAQLTNANGDAWFNNTFVDTHFTLTKSGYLSLCADYKFRNSPGTTSGTGANACPYLGAFNATFTATMLTLQQANGGSSGITFVGSSTPQPPTIGFDGNFTRTIPDRVAVNITRSQSLALFVGADHVDPATGVLQHNVVRAIFWDASASNSFNFYYPTRTKSGPQDKGLFVLWVMNDTGIVLATQKFFLEPNGTDWVRDDATITQDVITSVQSAGYTSAQQSYQQTFQASILAQQKTVRDQVYDDFQNIHNYGMIFVVLLGVLAVVRAFRR